MKFFEASLGTIVTRFYLMMAVIIVAVFAKIWLLAYLALPIFLSAMLGVKFGRDHGKVVDILSKRGRDKGAENLSQVA